MSASTGYFAPLYIGMVNNTSDERGTKPYLISSAPWASPAVSLSGITYHGPWLFIAESISLWRHSCKAYHPGTWCICSTILIPYHSKLRPALEPKFLAPLTHALVCWMPSNPYEYEGKWISGHLNVTTWLYRKGLIKRNSRWFTRLPFDLIFLRKGPLSTDLQDLRLLELISRSRYKINSATCGIFIARHLRMC